MSTLLSKIKWQMELINVFKLRKMLKTKRKNKKTKNDAQSIGDPGCFITDFNKQTNKASRSKINQNRMK